MNKKRRIIPVLLLKNGRIVQSKNFNRHQILGNPLTAVERLSQWASDELIYLDISKNAQHGYGRTDLNTADIKNVYEVIQHVAKKCFMPITWGGGIRSLRDIETRLKLGADKVSMNSWAISDPNCVEDAAKEFGSQCIVLSVDSKIVSGVDMVFSDFGSTNTGMTTSVWCKRVQELGAGEILLNSIDDDGRKQGYHIDMIKSISKELTIPLIACGGVGEWYHMRRLFEETCADAAAAANIFHYTDQSIYNAKKYLFDAGFNVRAPNFLNIGKSE